MQIEVYNIGKQKKEVRIETDWKDIQPDYNDILSEYLKVQVPGFRLGKAPKQIIEQRFRKEIFDDVAARCSQRLSRQALEKKDITSTGPISITDIEIERGEPFRFKTEFIVFPEFDLPDYTKFKLSLPTDAEKRDEISQWLLDNTRLDIPDELVKQELEFDDKTQVQPGSDDWNAALKRVKLLLIIRKIARVDGIELDEREVDERIDRIASEFGTTVSRLRSELLQNGGLSRISSFLLAEKVLDYLIEICS
ncbi:MAG: hypothetical protein JSV76_05950 [Candidatus Bathyarchaeota archaeon]|nr:MAG: hypothetical protein JSV76_05950 [Candidatus Bathyarchaeota archaeon]